MVSKSLFSGNVSYNSNNSYSRPLFLPIHEPTLTFVLSQLVNDTQKIIIQDNPDLINIKQNYITLLQKIQDDYGIHSASRNYELISIDNTTYIDLYDQISYIISITNDHALKLLLSLSKETLITSFHSVSLHTGIITLQIEKNLLQQKVNDLLQQANNEIIQNTTTSGQFAIVRNFQLAPVYNYYIQVYGVPIYGAGFDPIRISFLAEILTSLSINPYN
jgi:hypothetical protein